MSFKSSGTIPALKVKKLVRHSSTYSRIENNTKLMH